MCFPIHYLSFRIFFSTTLATQESSGSYVYSSVEDTIYLLQVFPLFLNCKETWLQVIFIIFVPLLPNTFEPQKWTLVQLLMDFHHWWPYHFCTTINKMNMVVMRMCVVPEMLSCNIYIISFTHFGKLISV